MTSKPSDSAEVEEMLECPWHGDATELDVNDNGSGCFWVVCNKNGCGCEGPYAYSEVEAIAAWNTRTQPNTVIKAGEVTVKPLGWHSRLQRGDREGFVCSEGGILSYSIMLSRFRVYGVHGPHDGAEEYPSLDAAKSAAQADYETRIRSALSPSAGGK